MTKFFLSFILFTSVIMGQEVKRPDSDSSFVSAALIKGVPIPLTNNDYFSNSEKSSFAVIYHNQNDWIYFISKQLSADSNSYILVLTSNGAVMQYSFLALRKIGKNKLYGTGKIKMLNALEVELYYFPKDNSISYKIASIGAIKSNIHFELGIRDELIIMLANEFSSQDGRFENTFKLLLPYNFHVTAGIEFLSYFKIDYRLGIIGAQDYILGIDNGLYFQAGLPVSNLYGVIGVDFFNNNLAADGNTWTGGKFTFYSLGLGYETSKNFSVDFLYSVPSGNRVYAREHSFEYGGPPDGFYDKKINGLFRFGFQYSFVF